MTQVDPWIGDMAFKLSSQWKDGPPAKSFLQQSWATTVSRAEYSQGTGGPCMELSVSPGVKGMFIMNSAHQDRGIRRREWMNSS